MSIRVGIRVPACESLDGFANAVREVEERGFSAVWVPDSQLLWRDTFAAMAFAAHATSTITLGTGVTNLKTRHPSVLASAANTVAELAPGRVRLAVGTGDSSVKLIGERPSLQVETREGVDMVRTLLAGQDWTFGDHKTHLRDATGPIPIYLAASGPKNVALAGEIGDGALLLGGASATLAEQNMVRLREGASRVGRSFDQFETVVAAFCHVTDEPERDARLLKPLVATIALTGGAHALSASGIEVDAAQIPQSVYPDYSHAEDLEAAIRQLDDIISDEAALSFAAEFCLFGPAESIVEQIRSLEKVGVTEVYLRHNGSYEVPRELIRDVGDKVLPLLAA